MPHVVAFDFEAAGGIPALHGFTQLGAAIVDVDTDKVVAEFSMYSSMKGYIWDDRCVREFWEKFPERYKETKEGVASAQAGPYEVVQTFIEWVKKHCKDMKDVFLLTDNSGFDAGLLRFFSLHHDILYIFGEYRPIVESSRFYSGIARKPVSVQTLSESSKEQAIAALSKRRKVSLPDKFPVGHDHNPLNDAKVMAWHWGHFQRLLKT